MVKVATAHHMVAGMLEKTCGCASFSQKYIKLKVNIKMERDDVGIVSITNIETGAEIVKERDFWFAWYAFHPETDVYRMKLQEEYASSTFCVGRLKSNGVNLGWTTVIKLLDDLLLRDVIFKA